MFLVFCGIAMPVKIFVGNLPAGISNEDIQALFEQYGTVTECAVLGSFGFVVSSLYWLSFENCKDSFQDLSFKQSKNKTIKINKNKVTKLGNNNAKFTVE